MRTDFLQKNLGDSSPSNVLKALLVTSSFWLLVSRFFISVPASRPQ